MFEFEPKEKGPTVEQKGQVTASSKLSFPHRSLFLAAALAAGAAPQKDGPLNSAPPPLIPTTDFIYPHNLKNGAIEVTGTLSFKECQQSGWIPFLPERFTSRTYTYELKCGSEKYRVISSKKLDDGAYKVTGELTGKTIRNATFTKV